MKKSFGSIGIIWMVLVALILTACGGGGDDGGDCSEAVPPAKTKYFGSSCTGFYYGACPTYFHDCVSDVCEYTSTAGYICTSYCSTDLDCPSGYYCKGVCMPSADCQTYNDGTCICDYINDPNDPTTCIQNGCTCF